MSRKTIVTRGNRITLTKAEMEKTNIRVGDKVIINIFKNILFITKRNTEVFDNFNSFLPSNFKDVMKKMRINEEERLKRFGIN